MTTLFIMRGFPGSGKSTLARKMALEKNAVIVNLDDMRIMLGLSKIRWRTIIDEMSISDRGYAENTIARAGLEIIRRMLKLGLNVISDAQHVVNRDARREIQIAHEQGADIELVDCDVDLNTLLQRNMTRPEDQRIDEKYIRDRYHGYHHSAFRPLSDLIVNPITLMDKMRDNANVIVKPVKGEDDLYACNFTRQAFFNHAWDDYSSKARGLFISRDGTVIMRGFDKFFNIGENEETSLSNVVDNVTYPVRIEVKQNGFLGIIGAKEDVDTFRFFSKSGKTDYSAFVQRGFMDALHHDKDKIHRIWKVLRDHNVTLVCEIIDQESDRHIIAYDHSTCYLIHAIKNQQDFFIDDQADDEIQTIVNDPALFTNRYMVKNQQELLDAIDKAHASLREGVVIYGSNGYMCKVKSDRYLHLKSLRTGLANVLIRHKDEPIGTDQRTQDILYILHHADMGKLVYHRVGLDNDDVDIAYAGTILDQRKDQ